LIKQEQFELEVLDRMKSKRILDRLVFTGGTMLRLCYGLNRFSADLDFWVIKEIDFKKLFTDIHDCLSQFYIVKDATEKFFTLLFEIKSPSYLKNLKIEIRREVKKVKTELTIAYSKYSNIQVLLNAVSPGDMMKAKIEAFLKRGEIRDVFDIEFLFKKGVDIKESKEVVKRILKKIESLSPLDYKVKLGSIIEEEDREYYIKENFKILKMKLKEMLKPV